MRNIVLDFKNKENKTVETLYYSYDFYSYSIPVKNTVMIKERKTGKVWIYRYTGYLKSSNEIRFFCKKEEPPIPRLATLQQKSNTTNKNYTK